MFVSIESVTRLHNLIFADCWESRADLLPRPIRASEAYDDRLVWPRNLDDVDIGLTLFPEAGTLGRGDEQHCVC